MDLYFVAPPMPVTLHAPETPIAIPLSNIFLYNRTSILGFWSVRDLWLEEQWLSQSETSCASFSAQVQPPAFTPHAPVATVVMFSW